MSADELARARADGWAACRKAAAELADMHASLPLCRRLFGEHRMGALNMAGHLRDDLYAMLDEAHHNQKYKRTTP